MKRCFFLIFFLASCSINETSDTPLYISADSSSYVILDKNKFDEKGLIPCITTDNNTGELLMVGYMNAEALTKTIENGEAYYFSR